MEVEPLSTQTVLKTLRALGSPNPTLRAGSIEKTGPLKTDQDNYIVDVPFPTPLLIKKDVSAAKGLEGTGEKGIWEVETLAAAIKGIEGVLSVGLFCGVNGEEAQALSLGRGGQKPVVAYFGMGNGSVTKRAVDADGTVLQS